MQTHLAPAYQGTPEGEAAEAILRKCVHCGFCTATCPTYQLLGDELDGPRGRIYLIKQVLEGQAPTRATQQHLDRCLTCRNCESTCPSGVQYGRLVEIGRQVVDAQVPRPTAERAVRWALKEGLPSPLFKPAMTIGQLLRPLLPGVLKDKLPAASATPASRAGWPQREHPRKMLLPLGCVQRAMAPNISAATARVLDAAGIQLMVEEADGCCGALRAHLSDPAGGLADARRNIDAWWPHIATGKVEAIVSNASACGLQIKDYGHALAGDAAYAERAARVSALTRDVGELLAEIVPLLKSRMRRAERGAAPARVVYHPPCTLQHGQRQRGLVEAALTELGFDVQLPAESHLCCGSAGTYSVLQPELSKQLRERKLQNIEPLQPQAIVSANVGCITHLQSGTGTPVMHWIEWVDRALA